ncbi:protein UL95 [Human betaherpesvirus 5]|uniref:Protein UL95 n=1 Tax=Human cytomegalovirus TaxID=10359 RepID=A0A0G2TI46_HCMV|nr:protein UL95 [Human betaherpesvirus 5]
MMAAAVVRAEVRRQRREERKKMASARTTEDPPENHVVADVACGTGAVTRSSSSSLVVSSSSASGSDESSSASPLSFPVSSPSTAVRSPGSAGVSTSLCSVERMVELSAQSPAADFSVSEAWRFEEAVNMALVACEAVSPYDRFRLIETPDENFLLVTNVIPRESAEVPVLDSSSSGGDSGPEDKKKNVGSKTAGEKNGGGSRAKRRRRRRAPKNDAATPSFLRRHDVLERFAAAAEPLPSLCVRDYALRNADRVTYDGELIYGSYLLYRKAHVELSLSSNKVQHVEAVLRQVYTPGLLDHHNVCDVEALLWLLYCGPRSFCARDTCFGREKNGCPFPALLPKLFYEPVRDYMTYMNLAELYVFVWYRGYEFPAPTPQATTAGGGGGGSGGGGGAGACAVETSASAGRVDDAGDEVHLPLKPVSLDRLREVLQAVRGRFSGREVPAWPASSRTCLLCALYSQNRLCLDLARDEARTVSYSPIVIQDCAAAVTDVTLSHILPGQSTVSLFPVYHVGKLLDALSLNDAGLITLNL